MRLSKARVEKFISRYAAQLPARTFPWPVRTLDTYLIRVPWIGGLADRAASSLFFKKSMTGCAYAALIMGADTHSR